MAGGRWPECRALAGEGHGDRQKRSALMGVIGVLRKRLLGTPINADKKKAQARTTFFCLGRLLPPWRLSLFRGRRGNSGSAASDCHRAHTPTAFPLEC